jgi:hypothetical protein
VQSRGTQDHILLSQFMRLCQPGGPGPHIYIPQEHIRSRSHIMTDSQSASQSWCQAPIRDPRPILS